MGNVDFSLHRNPLVIRYLQKSSRQAAFYIVSMEETVSDDDDAGVLPPFS